MAFALSGCQHRVGVIRTAEGRPPGTGRRSCRPGARGHLLQPLPARDFPARGGAGRTPRGKPRFGPGRAGAERAGTRRLAPRHHCHRGDGRGRRGGLPAAGRAGPAGRGHRTASHEGGTPFRTEPSGRRLRRSGRGRRCQAPRADRSPDQAPVRRLPLPDERMGRGPCAPRCGTAEGTPPHSPSRTFGVFVPRTPGFSRPRGRPAAAIAETASDTVMWPPSQRRRPTAPARFRIPRPRGASEGAEGQ